MEEEENSIDVELASLSSRLALEIDSDTKQIEILKKKIEKSNDLLKVVRARLNASNPSVKATGYGSKMDNVKNAINQIPKIRFTQLDVVAELRRAHPSEPIDSSRIRSTLWLLQKKSDFIKQVRAGNNRQPAEFEKVVAVANGYGPPKRKLPLPPQPVEQT